MDVISRAWLKEAIHNFFNGLTHEVTEEDIQRYIDVAPSAFEGMTNGEVIKVLFPQSYFLNYFPFCGSSLEKVYFDDKKSNLSCIMTSEEFWNALYKGVSE